MACRVGITTDPTRRRDEWSVAYPGLRNWIILSTHTTKTAAQEAENRARVTYGCAGAPGGAGPERATWHVYKFDY